MQATAGSIRVSDDSVTYDSYVRSEWLLFKSDSSRNELLAGLSIRRVLDIGCGAGQEMRPFLRDASVMGIGIDISSEAGSAGRELFAASQPESRVVFARAAAEDLPLASSSIDLIICRLTLPYTDNAAALVEIARVLRPDGVLLLKFHHARYYGLKLREACRMRRFKSALHACRVLCAGTYYQVTGRQPRNRFMGGETFQTFSMLERELAPLGLTIRTVLGDSVPEAPSVLIHRGHELTKTLHQW